MNERESGVVSNITPEAIEILEIFRELNRTPRCSGNERRFGQWLMDWSRKNGFRGKMDDAGNVVIHIPASSGYEEHPVVVLQGHQDMVCEKTSDSVHDFSVDPIPVIVDGEWAHADCTTLGADNGVAIAIGMKLALDASVSHPPMELLFTVDEERGLTGAFALESDFIKGRILLNLDSEWDGVFTIGCAGGLKSHHHLPCVYETASPGFIPLTLVVSGLSGGHSADIHHEKANALKILARSLDNLFVEIPFRISSVAGGAADNAIARDAAAVIWLPEDQKESAFARVQEYCGLLKNEFRTVDPNLNVMLQEGYNNTLFPYRGVFTDDLTERLIALLLATPHGIWAMSAEVEHFVDTSSNVANIRVRDGHIRFITSQRSACDSRLDAVTREIEMAVRLAGGESSRQGRYPGWQANRKSAILAHSVETWKRLFQQEPVVETTHGGLECGVIGSKFQGMDMISFGPVIQHPHSPQERLNLVSLGRVYRFLAALLAEL